MDNTRAERARAGKENAALRKLNAAWDDCNQPEICNALLDLVKMRGITAVARAAEMNRASIYAALDGNGNPTMGVLLSIVCGLELRLNLVPPPTGKAANCALRRRASKHNRKGVAVPRSLSGKRDEPA